MRLLDKKFLANWPNFIIQCLLAVIAIFVLLLFLDTFSEGAVIASFGATAFIVFLMPKSKQAKIRSLLGGHLIGTTMGCLCNTLVTSGLLSFLSINNNLDSMLMGAVAVGLSMLLMTIIDMEHPPAAGLSLGLVFQGYDLITIAVIFIGVIVLIIVKALLHKYLINLL